MQGSQRVVISPVSARESAWNAGSPPLGPYEAFILAIVTGRSKALAQNRATASWPILEAEYGGDNVLLQSPSGAVSGNTYIGSSCGLYTEWVDMISADLAARQCCSSSPVPSALSRIAKS